MEPIPAAPLKPFTWDGSNVGKVDEWIVKSEVVNGNTMIHFTDGTIAIGNGYFNSIPLIADELKPLFGIVKIGRHRCIIGGKDAIISRVEGVEFPFTTSFATQDHLESIRRAYVFRWALGLVSNVDASLWVRQYKNGLSFVTSYKETKFDYASQSAQGSCISGTILRRWFNTWDVVDETMSNIFKDVNMAYLRFAIEDIVKRLDRQLITWTSSIIKRIQERTHCRS